jgi:transposase-like protein
VLAEEHADLLHEGVALVQREVMEMEVARLAAGERYERSEERQAYRNGYRPRRLDTRVGSLELQIPKLRQGSSGCATDPPTPSPTRHCWSPTASTRAAGAR